jgi:hypothetical protein
MTTRSVEVLRQKHATLKDHEAELTRELRSLATVQENAKRIEGLRRDIRKVNEEMRENNLEIGQAKEERKHQRLSALVTSPEYREAIMSSLKAAADFLEPWGNLVRLEAEARQVNCPIPHLPPSVTSFVVELRSWIRPLATLGAINLKTLPPTLRALMEEGQ